jgi:hypothetical protein
MDRGGLIYDGEGVDIPWIGRHNAMGSVVDIPWIGGQNVMGRGSKYLG